MTYTVLILAFFLYIYTVKPLIPCNIGLNNGYLSANRRKIALHKPSLSADSLKLGSTNGYLSANRRRIASHKPNLSADSLKLLLF